jgi:hypothetical protein
MLFLLCLLLLVFMAFELPYMIKKSLRRETAVFICLLLIDWIYILGWILKLQLPTIVQLMDTLFTPATRFIEQLLS